jgi:hypothetical protein
MQAGKRRIANDESTPETLAEYRLKRRITRAALIKCVYEVNPLEFPQCGEEMRIIAL